MNDVEFNVDNSVTLTLIIFIEVNDSLELFIRNRVTYGITVYNSLRNNDRYRITDIEGRNSTVLNISIHDRLVFQKQHGDRTLWVHSESLILKKKFFVAQDFGAVAGKRFKVLIFEGINYITNCIFKIFCIIFRYILKNNFKHTKSNIVLLYYSSEINDGELLMDLMGFWS